MVAEFILEIEPNLLLLERLARIELQRAGTGLARIRGLLRARESERILDFGVVTTLATKVSFAASLNARRSLALKLLRSASLWKR